MSKLIDETTRETKKAYTEIRDTIQERYLVEDMTLKELKEEFSIDIPSDASPEVCRGLLSEIANMYESIRYFRGRAETTLFLFNNQLKQEYDEALISCRQTLIADSSNGRAPAKEFIEAAARQSVSTTRATVAHAEIAAMNIKQIVDKLVFQRKILESMVMSLGTEAKLMPHNV